MGTALAVLTVALLAVLARPLGTDDTWWHLAMGRMYASEGLWPAADPLFHTTVNRPPIPHEWLFQVVIHGVEVMTGFHGLRVLHALTVAGLLAAAFGVLRRAAASPGPAVVATAVFVGVTWFRLIQLRPDLWSVASALALYVLALRGGVPSWRRIGVCLGLFALWVNAHSLFAVGLALVLAALLGTGLFALLAKFAADAPDHPALADNRRRGARLAALLGLAVLVTLANPQGISAHLTFFTESEAGSIWQLRDDFLRYDPLRPAVGNPALTPFAWSLMTALGLGFAMLTLLRTLRFAGSRRVEDLRALDPVHLGLGAAAFSASLVAVRFHWLALFPLLYLLRGRPARAPARELLWAVAGLALAVAIPFLNDYRAFAHENAWEEKGYFEAPWLDRRYCGPGMRFLRDAGLQGRLYHPFNLGGFLGYWLAPDLRTFIDGRLDHVPPPVLDDYRQIRRTSLGGPTPTLLRLLDRWKIDVFFADAFSEREYAGRQSALHLRRLREWIPVFVAGTHAIYLRRNDANVANLERVERYWRARSVSFNRRRGFDVSRVTRERPDWALRLGWAHPEAERLEVARASDDPQRRAWALEALARHYWRVGDFEASSAADDQLVALRPKAFEPRRRLADALLQRGRPRAALAVARQLETDHPREPEAIYLLEAAKAATQKRSRD